MDSNEFDSFSTLQPIGMIPLEFQPSRFELWENGMLLKSGQTNIIVKGQVIEKEEKRLNQLHVTLVNSNLANNILSSFKFFLFITNKERLMLLHIPKSLDQDMRGLNALRTGLLFAGLGSICVNAEADHLLQNYQPYCCSLFLKNKKIAKLTFSINIPETLLEFYS